MNYLPENLPRHAGLALAHLSGVTCPTLDDLKLMVLVEASGQCFYDSLADAAPSPEMANLLRQNGREELGHAHRVRRAIEQLSGEPFTVVAAVDNPYFRPLEGVVLTREMLSNTIKAEQGGDALYGTWADNIGDEKAAELFRLNGAEESLHGRRLQQVADMLEAQ